MPLVWKHLPHNQKGTCFFKGKMVVSDEVQENVSLHVITEIRTKVKRMAQNQGGLNHLQVFVHPKTKACLLFIDQLSWDMKHSGFFKKKKNRCTLMFDYEFCVKPK